jgi:hypothetical protein
MVSFSDETIFKIFGGNHFIIGSHQAFEFQNFGPQNTDRRLGRKCL